MTGTPSITRLPELLRWRQQSPLAQELLATFRRHAAAGLARALARIDALDTQRGQTLRARLRALSAPVFLRLLTAPQTWYLVAGYQDAQPAAEVVARHLADSLDTEEAIAGGHTAHDRAVWSCVGDVYLPARRDTAPPDTAPPDPAPPDPATWHAAHPFTAPRLAGGIPVDFWSPFARGPLPDVSGSDVDPEPEEVATALDKLHAGAQATLQACPQVWKFVLQFSRVIVVRKDPPDTRKYTSASSATALGRPILRNPHLAAATPMELIDGLVHETIHGVIDIAELETPIVCDREVLGRARADSPWTGRSLDINTYVQACFVWYGLWNFWLRAFAAQGFPARRVLDYMSMSSRGFVHGDIARQLAPISGALTPGLVEVLRSMQAEVCDTLDSIGEVATSVA